MSYYWEDTPSLGKAGYVQSRLYIATEEYPWSGGSGRRQVLWVILHGDVYYVELARYSYDIVDRRVADSTTFSDLQTAKDWALALVRLS
jgi:hypothetical protein